MTALVSRRICRDKSIATLEQWLNGSRRDMRPPNFESAIVGREKIVGYLLNPEHRFGASKARFFAGFGFSAERWETFVDALREHARRNEVTGCQETGYGPRFEIDGELPSPDGGNPKVRTVWQLDKGQLAPRLITAIRWTHEP